jgi:hypothetical protein
MEQTSSVLQIMELGEQNRSTQPVFLSLPSRPRILEIPDGEFKEIVEEKVVPEVKKEPVISMTTAQAKAFMQVELAHGDLLQQHLEETKGLYHLKGKALVKSVRSQIEAKNGEVEVSNEQRDYYRNLKIAFLKARVKSSREEKALDKKARESLNIAINSSKKDEQQISEATDHNILLSTVTLEAYIASVNAECSLRQLQINELKAVHPERFKEAAAATLTNQTQTVRQVPTPFEINVAKLIEITEELDKHDYFKSISLEQAYHAVRKENVENRFGRGLKTVLNYYRANDSIELDRFIRDGNNFFGMRDDLLSLQEIERQKGDRAASSVNGSGIPLSGYLAEIDKAFKGILDTVYTKEERITDVMVIPAVDPSVPVVSISLINEFRAAEQDVEQRWLSEPNTKKMLGIYDAVLALRSSRPERQIAR